MFTFQNKVKIDIFFCCHLANPQLLCIVVTLLQRSLISSPYVKYIWIYYKESLSHTACLTQFSAYYDIRKYLFGSVSFLNDTFNEISNVDNLNFDSLTLYMSNQDQAEMCFYAHKACYEILTARAKITHPHNINVKN